MHTLHTHPHPLSLPTSLLSPNDHSVTLLLGFILITANEMKSKPLRVTPWFLKGQTKDMSQNIFYDNFFFYLEKKYVQKKS